jgi:uroporphyrin-III C-methyltransferase/precorrin-2 dehydrogenase/sirohydrochlorin ferrochelatase
VSDPLFPLFLKLAGRRVLLVGGGAVAAGKLAALRAAGAEVVVVAPEVRPEIADTGVHVERRTFAASDLDDVWLVVAAGPPEVNRQVAEAAAPRRLFVNAVDDPDNASAYLGGVLVKGGVTVAISTAGDAPALAGLLREGLESLVPDDVGRWRKAASLLKRRQRSGGVPMAQRRPELLRALNRLYEARGRGPRPEAAGRGQAPPLRPEAEGEGSDLGLDVGAGLAPARDLALPAVAVDLAAEVPR